MSTKYITALSAWHWSDETAQKTGQTIHEEERKPRDTGLLDASGVKLFAIDVRDPIGFVWPR